MSLARLAICLLLVLVLATSSDAADKKKNKSKQNNRSNAQRNAAQREAARRKAISNAIAVTKARLQAAERMSQAATAQGLARQSDAGESSGRFQSALRDKDLAESEAFGASQELADIRERVEGQNLQGSELYEARTAYEESIAELEKIRTKIYESDKFQLLYEAADEARERGAEIEKVMTVCFDEDPGYSAAKDQVLRAKSAYNRLRFELYEAEPDWEAAVARARAASAEKNRAGTSVKASAVESGLERSNARAAARRAAMAQAELADAQSDLKKLEKMKPSTKSSSQKSSKKK